MQDSEQPSQPSTGWQFKPEDTPSQAPGAPLAPNKDISVSWTAKEFLEHHKSLQWFVGVAVCAVVLAGVAFLVTAGDDMIPPIIVLIVAASFAFMASRKPRTLEYEIDDTGLRIGTRVYPYEGFKSFAVMEESGVRSIWLLPLKRFMPIIQIYYQPEDEQKILDAMSIMLPIEAHQPDAVDRLMSRIHF